MDAGDFAVRVRRCKGDLGIGVARIEGKSTVNIIARRGNRIDDPMILQQQQSAFDIRDIVDDFDGVAILQGLMVQVGSIEAKFLKVHLHDHLQLVVFACLRVIGIQIREVLEVVRIVFPSSNGGVLLGPFQDGYLEVIPFVF